MDFLSVFVLILPLAGMVQTAIPAARPPAPRPGEVVPSGATAREVVAR